VENLPLAANFSTIFANVVDTGGKFAPGVNDTSGKLQIYLYANSITQSCPKEIIKNFLIEDFFDLPPMFLTPVANLELQISPRIIEKNSKRP
jgi:hypothetical protein